MDGVILTPLERIYTPGGDVLHAMKKKDIGYNGFGEAYFSTINKGCIKGWKKHTKMTLNIVVPIGEIEFAIYNENEKKFLNIQLSKENYQRLTISPGLWLGFRGIDDSNMLLNLANIQHNPKESKIKNLDEIKYEWQS